MRVLVVEDEPAMRSVALQRVGAETVELSQPLRRVVGTLLSNAVAYNREGGRVWVSLVREGGAAVLRVEGTGVGIAPEHLPRLFERFHRVDPSRCGGRVEVNSDPGVGSVFTVRLPLPAHS